MLDKETKRHIYASLLKQSPPGEFNAVFDDLRTMNNDMTLLNEQCETTLVEYNHENFLPVAHAEIQNTLLTKYNLVSNENDQYHYIEPKSNKLFSYDHVQRSVQEVFPNNHAIDSALDEWRAALQKHLNSYVYEHYQKNGIGCVFIYEGNAIICIGSHKYQRRNCYNGRWCSQWTIAPFSTKRTTHAVNGRINVLTHYYEDGNVQMSSAKNFTLNVAYPTDMDAAAKEILKQITEAESSYLVNMQEKFSTFSDQTFKALRRPLPVTRTKMDWSKVHSYRMTKDMANAPQY
jgi:capping protein alpha